MHAVFSHIAKPVAYALVLSFALLATARAQTPVRDGTLYQRLGARAGISKIVDDFIPIVLADARINSFFKSTDTKHLALLLSEQFCQLSGGPCTYSGRDMVSAHEDMGVTLAHFNALAEDLQIAMENNGIASSTSNQLIAKLAPLQKAIVR
jgi:hemoglobin